MLIIPDFVIYDDVPVIYNYFDYYNIAKVKNVTLHEFPDRDYNTESYHVYSYAIIEIEEWYNNNCSKNFYQRICDEQCYMVYDEPNYWELYFYNANKYFVYDETSYFTPIKIENYTNENETSSDNQVIFQNPPHGIYDNESEASLDEEDNLNDETYEFEETDDEEDLAFEYYYKKIDSPKYYTRSQSKNKRKFNQEFNQLKEEVKGLKDLIIKKNKNYLKNNKTKVVKNEWSRRLRQKLFH
jgi:hypothetical protein